MQTKDYSHITEEPGARVTQEQVLRAYQRYAFAAEYCRGKDVLEVACGGGIGLALLADVARSVVGVDIEPKNLERAAHNNASDTRVRVQSGDAEHLVFADRSFDVVILFEAIYYLASPHKFFAECRRVLRPDGHLIISSANREWADFNPSLYSTKYFFAQELAETMEHEGFRTRLFQGFPIAPGRSRQAILLSRAKQCAVKWDLIPRSMKYKKLLKRIFVGRLVPLPNRLQRDLVPYHPPTPLDVAQENRQFKVIYAVGRRMLVEIDTPT